jgi:hypothetical protein
MDDFFGKHCKYLSIEMHGDWKESTVAYMCNYIPSKKVECNEENCGIINKNLNKRDRT